MTSLVCQLTSAPERLPGNNRQGLSIVASRRCHVAGGWRRNGAATSSVSCSLPRAPPPPYLPNPPVEGRGSLAAAADGQVVGNPAIRNRYPPDVYLAQHFVQRDGRCSAQPGPGGPNYWPKISDHRRAICSRYQQQQQRREGGGVISIWRRWVQRARMAVPAHCADQCTCLSALHPTTLLTGLHW